MLQFIKNNGSAPNVALKTFLYIFDHPRYGAWHVGAWTVIMLCDILLLEWDFQTLPL